MYGKNPKRLQVEVIKRKWLQNEYGYRILIDNVRNFILLNNFIVVSNSKSFQSGLNYWDNFLVVYEIKFTIEIFLQANFKKQNGVDRSKISKLFSEQGKLIDYFVQVDFVNLVDNIGLEEAIKQFFNVLVYFYSVYLL